jgi:uncharacterized membrane protein
VSRWVVLLHVAVAFWFVAGLVGRNLTLARARASDQLGSAAALVELAGRFERLMVIPGSFAVLVLGLLAAWATDRPFTGPGNGWLLASLLLYVPLFAMVPLVFLPRGACSTGRWPTPGGRTPSPPTWPAPSATPS